MENDNFESILTAQEKVIVDLRRQLAAAKQEIERLKEELRYALDFDPDGMQTKMRQLQAEIERLKTRINRMIDAVEEGLYYDDALFERIE